MPTKPGKRGLLFLVIYHGDFIQDQTEEKKNISSPDIKCRIV